MIKEYGIHPAHDAAVACNSLRHAIRELSDADESTPVGLGLAANLADVLADALDRYWSTVRRATDVEDRGYSDSEVASMMLGLHP